MASTATKPVSSIAMALAGQSPFVDIPKPRDAGHRAMLPTPPNSISPTLPPRKARPGSLSSRLHPPAINLDSDVDLQDAVDHADTADRPQTLSSAALANLDGAITPAMLAKHHLPDVLLAHGPMAIRHVLSHLTQSVPGFSRIPPAKARRLVVAALESRGGGGLKGDVEFEKVGWGRWDARLRGQPPREARQPAFHGVLGSLQEEAALSISPPASVPDSYAMSSTGALQIPRLGRPGRRRDVYSAGSWASSRPDHDEDADEDMSMAEHEADKMSLDGRDDGSSSPSSASAPDEAPVRLDDPDDATDEEDWAAIGAAALRAAVLPGTGGLRSRSSKAWLRSSGPRPSALARSAPGRPAANPPHRPRPHRHAPVAHASTPASLGSFGVVGGGGGGGGGARGIGPHDSQEREAVEALMRMGSM